MIPRAKPHWFFSLPILATNSYLIGSILTRLKVCCMAWHLLLGKALGLGSEL